MSAGAVVALEREHALVKRDGAPADRHGRLEHQPLPAELEVCPVDHDEGSLVSEQQGLNDRPIDAVALPLKMPISQQPIDGFDLMLRVRWAIEAAPEVGKRQLAAAEQCTHDAKQRRCACRVPDDQPIGEPL